MDDWKKVIAWHAAQEAEDRSHISKTNWLWQALCMLAVVFVCVSTAYTAHQIASWIGTGSEWAGIISLLVFAVTLAVIAKPS